MDSSASSPESDAAAGDHSPQMCACSGTERTLANFPALTEILTCSWCKYDELKPPVYQRLDNGDLACSECYAEPKYNIVGYVRNFAIEKILEGVQVRCKNASLGCTELCPLMSRAFHEEEDCDYLEESKCSMPGQCIGACTKNAPNAEDEDDPYHICSPVPTQLPKDNFMPYQPVLETQPTSGGESHANGYSKRSHRLPRW